jgi:predicted nucleic-acid-binding protein
MSSIRTDLVALDTNVLIMGLRQDAGCEACSELLFHYVPSLHIHIPLHVTIELQRNLTETDMTRLHAATLNFDDVTWSYEPASAGLVEQYRERGAKKGDAIISAQLVAAGVRWLISENRHFLAEIEGLPFKVISAAEAMASLE